MEEQTGSEGIQDSQGSSVLAEVGSGPTSSGNAGGHSSQPGGQDGPQMEELSSQLSGLNGSKTDLVNGKSKDEELEKGREVIVSNL